MHHIFAERARNAEVWDVEGRRYIDFAGGIGVLNTGHRHPKVMAAVREQMERFTHTCFQVMPYEPYVELAERLNALAPGKEPKKTLFLTTGSEAVENAVKIARMHTGRSALVAFNGGYHGRTMMTLGLSGKVQPYKAGFGPFPAEIFHALFPVELHGITVEHSLAALHSIFRCDVEPRQVAAIIIEPVQGEGGFYVAPFDFLRELRALCDEHGILLIADEIQAGAARTGKVIAIEHSGVVPDLITVAKSIGGGLPISAVVGRADVIDSVGPGGLGSMVAIELFKGENGQLVPDPELTKSLVGLAAKRGLILLSCGMHGNTIRILVAITGSEEIVDEGLDIIEGCLDTLTAA